MVNQSPTLGAALGDLAYCVWVALLAGGGIAGMIGVSFRWHYVEAIGLIAVGGAIFVLAVALMGASALRETYGVNYGLAGLQWALFVLLLARALVLRHQIRIRTRESGVIRGGPR
jgi:hypothetical protein